MTSESKSSMAAFLMTAAAWACGGSSRAAPCNPALRPYGPIAGMYANHGGSNGPLGCPTNAEHNAERRGRVQDFERGAITWSPDAGSHAVLASWLGANADTVEVRWEATDPFRYDFFIVRWDVDGKNAGQKDADGASRTGGAFNFPIPSDGRYKVIVEGCDGRLLAHSSCKQGWMNAVFVSSNRQLMCRKYADDAVEAFHKQERHGCGYSGARWQANRSAHEGFCMGASYDAVRSERQNRLNDLGRCACRRECLPVPVAMSGPSGIEAGNSASCTQVCRPF
jgi:hypothetical protein